MIKLNRLVTKSKIYNCTKKLNSEISRYLNDRMTGCDFSFIMLFMLDTYIDSHCLIMRISIKSTLLWGKNWRHYIMRKHQFSSKCHSRSLNSFTSCCSIIRLCNTSAQKLWKQLLDQIFLNFWWEWGQENIFLNDCISCTTTYIIQVQLRI